MQTLTWAPRALACEPAGVVAQGAVARRLMARLHGQPEESLASLAMVAAKDLLVLMGRAEQLPWVDGVRYCAPDPAAPNLWLPTLAAPTLSPDLLQSTLAARVKRAPVLLWDAPEQIMPLDRPTALNASLLEWLMREFD
jgi:hypothetical protein